MSTYTATELLAMSDEDIGRHLSRGYGLPAYGKMLRTIRDLAKGAAK